LDDGVENPEQFLVPRAAPDLHMADAALRAERPKARQLVATLAGRGYGEAAEHVHQVMRLALAYGAHASTIIPPRKIRPSVIYLTFDRNCCAYVLVANAWRANGGSTVLLDASIYEEAGK